MTPALGLSKACSPGLQNLAVAINFLVAAFEMDGRGEAAIFIRNVETFDKVIHQVIAQVNQFSET